MIEEQVIDKVLEQLEQADFEQELLRFKEQYPLIYSYLLNEQLASLTEEEFQLMLFDALVIYRCFKAAGYQRISIDPVKLEEMESANWALLKNSKPVGFNEKLDIFFSDTQQEDLLAFIEDSLAEDDEFQVSSAAKEIVFICLKTLLDLFEKYSG